MKGNQYSNEKIFGFPYKIASFRSGQVSAPVYVRIKPTNRCNHDCEWCIYAQSNRKTYEKDRYHLTTGMHNDISLKDEMPSGRLLEIVADLSEIGVKAVTFSGGGEPLLHEDIVPAMDLCQKLGLEYSIITNGQLLTGKRAESLALASWVRVSMDYANGEQMAKSRGVLPHLFDMVLENIRSFARCKSEGCDFGVNFVVHRGNYMDLLEISSRLRELGVGNIRFSPLWREDFTDYHAPIAMQVIEAIERQIKPLETDTFTLFNGYDVESPAKFQTRGVPRCYYMQTVPVIGADLNVYACHNKAYDKTGLIGSIRDRKFSELWFSPEARLAFWRLNPILHCRHECANHHKVNLMHRLATAPSDNFV